MNVNKLIKYNKCNLMRYLRCEIRLDSGVGCWDCVCVWADINMMSLSNDAEICSP